ncbi:MAG: hypothetical protein WCS09_02875 [Pseudomonadota bacterium]
MENIDHSASDAESLQQRINRRAYRLSQGQYQRYRRMLAADLAAGRVTLDSIDGWDPDGGVATVPADDPMGDLPL